MTTFLISSGELEALLAAINSEADEPITEVRIYSRSLPKVVMCDECRWFDREVQVCWHPAAARRVRWSDFCSFGKPRENVMEVER